MTTKLVQSEITTLNNEIDIIEAKLKKLKTQKKYEEEIHDVFDKGGTPEKLRMILDMCKECDFDQKIFQKNSKSHINRFGQRVQIQSTFDHFNIYNISKSVSPVQKNEYHEASKVYAITYPMFECLLDIVHKQDIRISELEEKNLHI